MNSFFSFLNHDIFYLIWIEWGTRGGRVGIICEPFYDKRIKESKYFSLIGSEIKFNKNSIP